MSDFLIVVAQALFIVSMFPTFRSNEFPPSMTMYMTTAGLFVMMVALAILGQWGGFLMTGVNFLLWFFWTLRADEERI